MNHFCGNWNWCCSFDSRVLFYFQLQLGTFTLKVNMFLWFRKMFKDSIRHLLSEENIHVIFSVHQNQKNSVSQKEVANGFSGHVRHNETEKIVFRYVLTSLIQNRWGKYWDQNIATSVSSKEQTIIVWKVLYIIFWIENLKYTGQYRGRCRLWCTRQTLDWQRHLFVLFFMAEDSVTAP